MSNVNIFTNAPQFAQKPTSIEGALKLKHLDALLEANPETCSWQKCGDELMGTTWRKNLLHTGIRCGGSPIDITTLEDMFPNLGQTQPSAIVGSKTWYNRYIADVDFNIYAANTVRGAEPGAPVTFVLLRSNHASGGTSSFGTRGQQLFDIERSVQYTIWDVDTSVPYQHRYTVRPNEKDVVAEIKANKPYLIVPAHQVGGCHCPLPSNDMVTAGYVQKVQTIGVRKDWKLCIETLSGFSDKLQYAITYDYQGNQVDNFLLLEEQNMRIGIRMALNAMVFNGTPTTNEALLSTDEGFGPDSNHQGFYGMIPTLKYGGGNVYNFREDVGFDFSTDGERIFLYADSRKRSKEYFAMHGLAWRFGVTDKTNGLVARTDTGSYVWEAYQRIAETRGETHDSIVSKLGVRGYEYDGFKIDMKKMDSWSDYRYFGRDYLNNMAIFMPKVGTKEFGREISPIEFNTFGQGQWNGNYEEHFRDMRKINGCNDLEGHGVQYTAMTLHCPGQWFLINPIKAY